MAYANYDACLYMSYVLQSINKQSTFSVIVVLLTFVNIFKQTPTFKRPLGGWLGFCPLISANLTRNSSAQLDSSMQTAVKYRYSRSLMWNNSKGQNPGLTYLV